MSAAWKDDRTEYAIIAPDGQIVGPVISLSFDKARANMNLEAVRVALSELKRDLKAQGVPDFIVGEYFIAQRTVKIRIGEWSDGIATEATA